MTHDNNEIYENLENLHQFPIQHIEHWFFGNLDATRLPSWFTQFRSHDSILRRIAQILTRQGRFNEYSREEINDLWKKVASLENYIYELETRLDVELKEIWEEIRLIKLVDARQDLDIDNLKQRADASDLRDDGQDTTIGELISDNVINKNNINNHNIKITNLENRVDQHDLDISEIQLKDNEQDDRLTDLENSLNNLEPYLRDLYVDVLTGRISTVPRGLEEALKTLPGYDEGAVLRVNQGWPTWGFEPPALEFDTIFEYEDTTSGSLTKDIRITSGSGTRVYQVDENDNETLIYEGTLLNTPLANLTSIKAGKIKIQGRTTKLGKDKWEPVLNYASSGITKIHKWADTITTLNLGYGYISKVPESLPKMITSLRGIFAHAGRTDEFSLPEIENWDTNRITDMSYAFYTANINNNLNSWDTRNVLNMEGIFAVKSNTASTDGVFNNGSTPGEPGEALTWNTSNVKNFKKLAEGNNGFNVDISGWDTSSGTDFSFAFKNSKFSTFNQDLSSWNMDSAVNLESMFEGANNYNNGGQPLNWSLPKVTSLVNTFRSATSFNQPVPFTLGKLTRIENVFRNATSFNQDVNSWDVSTIPSYSSVTDGIRGVFYNATSFNNGSAPGVSDNPLEWYNYNNSCRIEMFMNAVSFNQDVSSLFSPNPITNENRLGRLDSMFEGATSFNQELNLILNIPNSFNTINVNNFFKGASSWNNGSAPGVSDNPVIFNINRNVGSINTLNMRSMFMDCESFNQDCTNWIISNNPISDTTSTTINRTDYDTNTPLWLPSYKPVFPA